MNFLHFFFGYFYTICSDICLLQCNNSFCSDWLNHTGQVLLSFALKKSGKSEKNLLRLWFLLLLLLLLAYVKSHIFQRVHRKQKLNSICARIRRRLFLKYGKHSHSTYSFLSYLFLSSFSICFGKKWQSVKHRQREKKEKKNHS